MSEETAVDGQGPNVVELSHEWEICRENIRPLRQGRRIAAINEALAGANPQKNAQIRAKEKFDEITQLANESEDPLQCYLEYIRWFDESFPFGRQKLFYEYLWKIITSYAKDPRYINDDRMLKVWDKLAENSLGNGWKIFQHANTIGSLLTSAPFYVRWAKLFELANSISEARKVYRRARANHAAPIDLLNTEENEMEMRQMRRELADRANDSWEEEPDIEEETMMDENGKRVALTRLQGLGDHAVAPVVRLPSLVGEGGSSRLHRDGKTTSHPSGNGFQIFTEETDDFERDCLQSVYEMDTHIEHIHLTEADERKERALRRLPLKVREPQPCGFEIYDETAQPKVPPKPKLMLRKAMREDSVEEIRLQHFLAANKCSEDANIDS
ncbi:unnamed protein product, partial [Mesorhabditis spiculigera]